MFTGLVRELGHVQSVELLADDSARLTISTSLQLQHGDSVCVNGVCLTVADLAPGQMTALAMKETLTRSTTGQLRAGDAVNLEPALTLQTPLGGHIVQGHVDGVGRLVARSATEHWDVVSISVPAVLARYFVEKGSVAVDGVSLTVAAVRDESDGSCEFDIYLIPVTLEATTMGQRTVGSHVNIEVDILAKYVERLSAQ